MLNELGTHGVRADVWIDGSFLTQKIDPEDADIVLCVDHDAYDSGTIEQRQALDWVGSNLKNSLGCDSYLFCTYPDTHPLHWEGQYAWAYWLKQFGFSRGNDLKGVAVVRVP